VVGVSYVEAGSACEGGASLCGAVMRSGNVGCDVGCRSVGTVAGEADEVVAASGVSEYWRRCEGNAGSEYWRRCEGNAGSELKRRCGL